MARLFSIVFGCKWRYLFCFHCFVTHLRLLNMEKAFALVPVSKTRQVLKRVGGSRDFNKDTLFLLHQPSIFLEYESFLGAYCSPELCFGFELRGFPAPTRTAVSGGQVAGSLARGYICIYIYIYIFTEKTKG